jgi:hypothetical protein
MTPRRAAILAAGWSLLLAAKAAPGADLSSRPPGVHLSLHGRVTLSGVTPLPLEDLPPGSYRLLAQGLGTLQARGRLLRGGSEVRVERAVGPKKRSWPPVSIWGKPKTRSPKNKKCATSMRGTWG